MCKASAGAVEHLAIARVRNIADFLGEAKEAGFWCYGAAADGRVSCFEVEWPERVALVLGAEGKGLRPRVAKACDELVLVPMRGQLDSLNVSATAALSDVSRAATRISLLTGVHNCGTVPPTSCST